MTRTHTIIAFGIITAIIAYALLTAILMAHVIAIQASSSLEVVQVIPLSGFIKFHDSRITLEFLIVLQNTGSMPIEIESSSYTLYLASSYTNVYEIASGTIYSIHDTGPIEPSSTKEFPLTVNIDLTKITKAAGEILKNFPGDTNTKLRLVLTLKVPIKIFGVMKISTYEFTKVKDVKD